MAAYSCMGFKPVERTSNADMTMKAQVARKARNPTLTAVYETDNKAEALGVLKDGGFTDANGQWVVVNEIRMNNLTAGQGTISKSSAL